MVRFSMSKKLSCVKFSDPSEKNQIKLKWGVTFQKVVILAPLEN